MRMCSKLPVNKAGGLYTLTPTTDPVSGFTTRTMAGTFMARGGALTLDRRLGGEGNRRAPQSHRVKLG